jgi:hypothetical protein
MIDVTLIVGVVVGVVLLFALLALNGWRNWKGRD